MSEIDDDKEYVAMIHTSIATITMVFSGHGLKTVMSHIFAPKEEGGLAVLRLQDDLFTHCVRSKDVISFQFGEFDAVNKQHKKAATGGRGGLLRGFTPRKLDG